MSKELITPEIKALFVFVEYLNSLISVIDDLDNTFKKLYLKRELRDSLNPYKDAALIAELNNELKEILDAINTEVTNPIKQKALELNLINSITPNMGIELKNKLYYPIQELIKYSDSSDYPEVYQYKIKYQEFREAVKGRNILAGFLLMDLDELLTPLFNHFEKPITTYSKNEIHKAGLIIKEHYGREAVTEIIAILKKGRFDKVNGEKREFLERVSKIIQAAGRNGGSLSDRTIRRAISNQS